MPARHDKKMYTLRHFFFYLALCCLLGAVIGITQSLFGWSDDLTFVVGIVVGTICCTVGVREDLFERPSRPREHHRRA
jgi:hypothetical protein